MKRRLIFLAIYLLSQSFILYAESFRTVLEGSVDVTPDNQAGSTISMGINSSILINLANETRFLRGIEIDISAPQAWLSYRGSLVMAVYNKLMPRKADGPADLNGSRIAFEPLPGKLQIIYQIPIRQSHGLRTTPYITVPTGVVPVDTFPVLFRFSPAVKGLNDELESMLFNISVRPILSNEGAVRLIPHYPPQLRGKPFILLIDDNVVENVFEQHVLKEGEHHLVILSEDYRNESRRFIVEKAKILDLYIELQDTTPLIIFEGPENAVIFLDNVPISRSREPVAVEPGQHEAKFQISDYTVTRTLTVQRGKTYRVSLEVDLNIHEED